MNTYTVKVILEIEAETYDEAEEQAMFAVNEDNSAVHTKSVDIIDVEENTDM